MRLPRLTIRRLMVVVGLAAATMAAVADGVRNSPNWRYHRNREMARAFRDGKGAPRIIRGYLAHFQMDGPNAVKVTLYRPGDYIDYLCYSIDCGDDGGYENTIKYTEGKRPKIDGR